MGSREAYHLPTFRFHTGSIKRTIGEPISISKLRFDSILVRLKVIGKVVGAYSEQQMFRFHTGSIKSKLRHDVATDETRVSIPYWFD